VTPLLAAVSLDERGGGVALVARLLWEVMQREWGRGARLLRLIDGQNPQPTFADKSRYALRLAALQASPDIDLILYSHLRLAKPLLGVPRAYRKPYAVFLHGIEAWRGLPPGQLQLLADAELRLANSAFTARRVMAAHPQIGPVESCPLALTSRTILNAETAESAEKNHKGSSAFSAVSAFDRRIGAHAVLVVGRMASAERYKGHDQLIDAWPEIVAHVPDAQLVVVGSGDDEERLRRKAAESPAAELIVFTGFIPAEALASLYARAALLALPSKGEGFGLVYLEAMAHRLACVGSIHDAAGDVVVDRETGWLVNQDDRRQLADVVVRLLRDEDLRTRMGQAGYRRLQTEFTVDAFARRFVGLVANSRVQTASAPPALRRVSPKLTESDRA
jgi:phosphatidylinositol alpha-1,6-mannosyltransferase